MDIGDAMHLLGEDPDSTGIFTDFDGTLAPIVDRPADARPLEGAAEALTELAALFPLVAVVSGRSLEDLRARFAPPGVVLAGSYGRERSDVGGPRRRTEGWEAVSIAAAAAAETLPGVVAETKGQGVALHYRLAPEAGDEVQRLSEALAHEFGLEVRPGRLVVELVAPGPGKGEVIETMVRQRGLRTLLFAGDDVADLEAFRVVRSMDVRAVLVAVVSEEAPDELTETADLTVVGPEGFLAIAVELGRSAMRPPD